MDKFLSRLLGWAGIALVGLSGFVLSLWVGLGLQWVATAFCSEPDVISGACSAAWFPWVERGITLIVAALTGALVVSLVAAVAERSQRRAAAAVALAFTIVFVLMMANTSGPSDGGFLLEALATTGCGIWALYRVHLRLDPAQQKARYKARKKKSGSRWGLVTRRRKQTARRGVPRSKVVRARHRRRSRWMLDPGSPSPALGKAAMTALVLVSLWSVFMIIVFVTHNINGIETETLSRFGGMFNWWMLTAFLTMLFLVVEMAGRAAVSPARNFRRLASDLFALILVTLMLVCNGQFSRLYADEDWQRNYAHIPNHSIRGDFSYPSTLDPDSTANKEWLEFQKWLDWSFYSTSIVRLEFQPQQPIRHLAQCTPELWRAQCREIRFQVGDGPEHVLRRPSGWYWNVLSVPDDGDLNGLLLLPGFKAGPFSDQVSSQEIARVPEGRGPIEPNELDQIIEEADRYSPLQILVHPDATVQWLDSLLSKLEERGAKSFVLIFRGP